MKLICKLYYMSERGLVMCIHSIAFALLAYIFMCYVLKQNTNVAENRSILLGAAVLIYMVLFGHNIPPNGINPQLF